MIFCAITRESKAPRRVVETKPCAGCGEPIPTKRRAPNFYCGPCAEKSIRAQRRLQSLLRTAVRRGELAPMSPDAKCVDCDARAYGYEHRDYLKPLEVVPICRSCNWKRGPAINLEFC